MGVLDLNIAARQSYMHNRFLSNNAEARSKYFSIDSLIYSDLQKDKFELTA